MEEGEETGEGEERMDKVVEGDWAEGEPVEMEKSIKEMDKRIREKQKTERTEEIGEAERKEEKGRKEVAPEMDE